MIITPKQTVTINGIEYLAESTYNVNHTIFTKMVVAGALKMETVTTSTVDHDAADEVQQTESTPAVRKPRRRNVKK